MNTLATTLATILAAALAIPPAAQAPTPRTIQVPTLPGIEVSAGEEVDVALVLLIDASGSISAEEYQIQRDGYASAFRSPDVAGAIRSGIHGRIAVTAIEWASPEHITTILPWRVIEDDAAAKAVAASIETAPAPEWRGTSTSTSISAAFGAAHVAVVAGSFKAIRTVIDVSGDGVNSGGDPIEPARAKLIAAGMTINGLPIVTAPSDAAVVDYYGREVIGGPGAFLVAVEGFGQFAEAVRRKLVLEIAGDVPRVVPVGGL